MSREDVVIEELLRVRSLEQELDEKKRKLAYLMREYGEAVLEIEEIRPGDGKMTQREAVLEVVRWNPGILPAGVWEEVKKMGVKTRNPSPPKAMSMALRDLRAEGLVEHRDDGWYLK